MIITREEKQILRQVFDAAVKSSQDAIVTAMAIEPLLNKLCSASEIEESEQELP